MNPYFRYVKPKYLDLRKLSYSLVTSLKDPEHLAEVQKTVSLKSGPNTHISNQKCQPKSSELHDLQERGHRKHYKLEHQKSHEIFPYQQKLNLECLIDKQWGLASSVIQQNDKSTGVFRASSTPKTDLDSNELEFSKGTDLSQNENLSPRESKPMKKYQSGDVDRKRSNNGDKDDGPSHAQLLKVLNYYETQILSMHRRTEDFSHGLHSEDIIFENNYTRYPKSCQGLMRYGMALAKMRLMGYFSYISFRFVLVDAKIDMEEGAVMIHWRFCYVNNIRFFTHAIIQVIKDRSFQNAYDTDDAISTFYVNSDGQITKHKVDNKIPLFEKKKAKGLINRLRRKLNLAVT